MPEEPDLPDGSTPEDDADWRVDTREFLRALHAYLMHMDLGDEGMADVMTCEFWLAGQALLNSARFRQRLFDHLRYNAPQVGPYEAIHAFTAVFSAIASVNHRSEDGDDRIDIDELITWEERDRGPKDDDEAFADEDGGLCGPGISMDGFDGWLRPRDLRPDRPTPPHPPSAEGTDEIRDEDIPF